MRLNHPDPMNQILALLFFLLLGLMFIIYLLRPNLITPEPEVIPFEESIPEYERSQTYARLSSYC